MSNPAAMIYVADGATGQALSTTPAKFTGFATDGHDGSAVGGDVSVQADAANDKITIGSPGLYWVQFCVSGSLDAVDVHVNFALRRGTTEIPSHQCKTSDATADDPQGSSFAGPVLITEAMLTDGVVDLSVYAEVASGTDSFTAVHAQLAVMRIG